MRPWRNYLEGVGTAIPEMWQAAGGAFHAAKPTCRTLEPRVAAHSRREAMVISLQIMRMTGVAIATGSIGLGGSVESKTKAVETLARGKKKKCERNVGSKTTEKISIVKQRRSAPAVAHPQ